MRIADLPPHDLEALLRGPGLSFRAGPYWLRLHTRIRSLIDGFSRLYADYPCDSGDGFADFHVELRGAPGWRRWLRPQVQFRLDGRQPFKPLPLDHAYAMFEWTCNWCIANHMVDHLLLHAAAVDWGGASVLLPGAPGAGKSTLCAGLVSRGARLLTDELCLLRLDAETVTPLPRPINLKNDAIEVIAGFSAGAVFGPVSDDTVKGRVAHLRPPAASIAAMDRPSRPRAVVFPRYAAGAEPRLRPMAKALALLGLAENSFNYHVLGATGFHRLADMVESCECYEFRYGDLDQGVAGVAELLGAARELAA